MRGFWLLLLGSWAPGLLGSWAPALWLLPQRRFRRAVGGPTPNPHFLHAFYANPTPSASIVYAPPAEDTGLFGVIRRVVRTCLPPHPSTDVCPAAPAASCS